MRYLILSLLLTLSFSCALAPKVPYANHKRKQNTLATQGGNLAYTDQGSGDAIVLLHGVPTSSWVYRKIIPKLSKNHRVIAPDLLGFGNSDKPADDGQVYTPAAQAKRVRELMASLGISNYSILMHDMGGLVAWEMLRQDTPAVKDLIVLNTIIHKEGFHPPTIKPTMLNKNLIKAYSNDWSSDAILGMTFRSLGLSDDHKLTSAECYGYVAPMKQGSDKALYAFFTSLNDKLYSRLESNRHVFHQFQGDTLVLWGEKDKILTTAQLPFLKKHLRIPEENICLYPKNDHFLVEEIPEEVVRQITRFLNE